MNKVRLALVGALSYVIVALMSACNPGGVAVDGGAQVPKLGVINPVQNFYPAPTRHQFASENSYCVATNPTIGTGTALVTAQTSFSDTAPVFYIQNNENSATGRTLFLDYVKMIATAVNTSATSVQYAIKLDTVARTLTTNNTQAISPVAVNTGGQCVVGPTILAQNNATTSAYSASSGSARIVARGVLGGLLIAGRELAIVFGDLGPFTTAAGNTDAAGAPGRFASSEPPLAIGPGQNASIYIWMPASAATFNPEFEIGFWAR